MIDFAGWQMPVSYPTGIIEEHLACRRHAALFDVSHMGQILLDERQMTSAAVLMPNDMMGLQPGRSRYTVFLNDDGGIEDDLIVTRWPDGWGLVVNAARSEHDVALLARTMEVSPEIQTDQALLALQGPASASILAAVASGSETLSFMQAVQAEINGVPARITRSGYTGEDGFEISLPASQALALADMLCRQHGVTPAGLGARDTLRLEAGLCLYGHELDSTTTPLEAGISWIIDRQRLDNRLFPGAETIARQMESGDGRRLTGLLPEGRAPVRQGARVVDQAQNDVGVVTSGGHAPTLERPVAMALVQAGAMGAQEDRDLFVEVRGKLVPVRKTNLPFVEHRYYRA